MSRHIELYGMLFAVVPALATVIVGKRWPPPRWFLADSTPPGTDQVVADTDNVVADTDNVIAS